MYRLKRKKVSYSARNGKLSSLLKEIAGGYEVQTNIDMEYIHYLISHDHYWYEVQTNIDMELGAMRYVNLTVAQILEDLQQKTNLYSYFVGKTLHCGNVYTENTVPQSIRVELEKNAVSQDLNETNGEYQVKAISIGAGGQKLEATAGTEGGEVYCLTYNEKEKHLTQKGLEELATHYYEGLKKQKFKGGVELFGIPVVHHGMQVELSSTLTPEMNGTYFVEKVTKDFSDNATYRQKIELGGRAE